MLTLTLMQGSEADSGNRVLDYVYVVESSTLPNSGISFLPFISMPAL